MVSGPGLYCDEYELTMAQSFWRHDQTRPAAFELFVRTLPVNRGYLAVGGVDAAIGFLEGFRFLADDLDWLTTVGYDAEFLRWLATLRFTGDVDAIPDGTVIGACTPILRVVAPRVEATLVETALLALVNHETTITTKACRIVDAARGRPVWDFSMRRLHGLGAGLGVARSAYIGGCAGTATVVAGHELGVPITGTMAHQYIMAFGEAGEQRAFEQFMSDFPHRGVMLVDTYDTQRGVLRAIAASRATGVHLAGVRLDSGDLAAEAVAARRVLDEAGMHDCTIVASGDLDEYRITELLDAGAPINSFGVGTMLGTSADAPALGGVYKLVAQQTSSGEWHSVMKRSLAKVTDPGRHQVFRQAGGGDIVACEGEHVAGVALLEPAMRGGRRILVESLDTRRERCRREVEALPIEVRRLSDPTPWRVTSSPGLVALREQLTAACASPAGS